MTRRGRLYVAALGFLCGLGLGGCPGTVQKFTDIQCTTLCQSARACGVIPSALGGVMGATSDEDYVDLCAERCLSSNPARADIAKAILDKAKVEIDRHQIVLDKPIKGTGEFEIPVKVHADIEVVMTLKVKAEKDEEDDSEGGSDN